MSKKLMLCALILGSINAQSDFLSQDEYGKNLYQNPRGIACSKCHGESGEPTIIAHYKHKGIEKTLLAPRINNLEFSTFSKALKKQKGVMPTYYLTEEEIKAIYIYLYRP